MGKPSSLSSKKSNSSMNAGSIKLNTSGGPLSISKFVQDRKKKKNKTKEKIKKIINTLQSQDTQANLNTASTRISEIPFPPSTGNKCSLNHSQNIIVIHDEPELEDNQTQAEHSHIRSSTPVNKHPTESIFNNNLSLLENKNGNVNTTKNADESYITIDLTGDNDFDQTSNTDHEIVKLDDTSINLESPDVISASNGSVVTDSDSDVTVILQQDNRNNMLASRMRQFTKGIAKLNESSKGKLLEFITEKIFSGCALSTKLQSSVTNLLTKTSQATETYEDKYIKEVILRETPSRNSIGSNIYNPQRQRQQKTGLRMIVIDGSNVAMEHTKGKEFSVKGLKICIDYFLRRGHTVKAFVPRFRCKFGKSTDPRLLDEMERNGCVIYTPSREIRGRTVTPYDDRYIIQCAAEFEGVIVTGDNYRDLVRENVKWAYVINNRLLPFTWVDDMIMFPKDPLGRNGPSLEEFLRHPPAPNKVLTS